MPKAHRGGSTTLLRSHSRSSSTSKLGANLQFTQKEQYPPKPVDKPKKNIATDSNQAHTKGLARVASTQRVHSREHVQPLVPKQRAPPPQKSKGKTGFTISSPGEEEEEDEWVSSESGAATPRNDPSSSETDPDDEEAVLRLTGERQPQPALPVNGSRIDTATLPRVETARLCDFRAAVESPTPPPQPETQQQRHDTRLAPFQPPPIRTTPPPHTQHKHRSLDGEVITEQGIPSPSQPSSRPSGRRHASTRPPSAHSMRMDHPLRPHPLIRGHSYGQVYPVKPSPLEPLTVIQDTSLPGSTSDVLAEGGQLSTSPTSSLSGSAHSPSGSNTGSSTQHRRQSVSSARSVSTLPVGSGLRDSVNWSLSDRRRTLSTVSHSSSSAALSSLVHLPTVTRPPSPQAIAFFPPVNPHANLEGIHPLLPGPYLSNHLTILARRTPIKESFDRVIRAKQVRAF